MLLGDAGKTVNELLAELTKMDLGNGAGVAAPAAAKPAAVRVCAVVTELSRRIMQLISCLLHALTGRSTV